MTVTIPKWALAAIGVTAVAIVALLIGQGSDENDSASGGSQSETASLECNEEEMTKAVSEGEFADAVLALGAVPPDRALLDVYQAELVDCVDLTGDGKLEMIVQLRCCAGSAPVFPWAIFTQTESEWVPGLIRNRMPAPQLVVSKAGVKETVPAFADGDARCCPSGRREGRARWDGSRFVFEPSTGTSNRMVALAGDTPESLGGLPVQTANLRAAIEVFGVPSEYFRGDVVCPAQWRDIGLQINFVNLGGRNPCGTEGAVGSAAVGGFEAEQAGWKTDRGAKIGTSQEELRALYPKMAPDPARSPAVASDFPGRPFYLISRPSVIGSTGSTPSLAVRLDSGTATAYELYVGAGGD